MKSLLSNNNSSISSEAEIQGKVMHMTSNVEKDSSGNVVKGQIKCYFVFRNQSSELQT
jgi:hypothetical protein